MRSVDVALLAVFGVLFSTSQVAYCSPHYELVELDEEFFDGLVKVMLQSIWQNLTDKEQKAYKLELMELVRELRDKLHMSEFDAMNYLAPFVLQ